MKSVFLIIASTLYFLHASFAQQASKYNQQLADSLGADEYGMKMYSFVILKTGETQMEEGDERSALFAGHMKNIGDLVKANKLIVAGPFGNNDDDFRGLFIFTEADIEKTKALLATDPAIAAGLLAYDIYPWYGSAALGMYLPYSVEVTKKNP